MDNTPYQTPIDSAANVPPDWAARDKELLCPLCGYNLRGLTESRCPECGFKFTWPELLEAEKDRQIYLFEYGQGRNLRTFWKTFWRTCRPRRFWREITPAYDVKWARLLIYWILSSSTVASILAVKPAQYAWTMASRIISIRADFKPVPGMPNYFSDGGSPLTARQLDDMFPPPWHFNFWLNLERNAGGFYPWTSHDTPVAADCCIFVLWPILTLISLMIFRMSMRQAKIRTRHLVRAVVYSCDFGLLLAVGAFVLTLFDENSNEGSILMAFAAICAVFTTYRLTFAAGRYLRVHMPLATVLASQLIALLIAFVVLVQIADFSRLIH